MVILEMLEYLKNNFYKLQTEILQKKGFSLLQKIFQMLKTQEQPNYGHFFKVNKIFENKTLFR